MGELINGRTPEHIKAGLRCRVTGDVKCSDCAYYGTVLYEIGQREYECDNIDRDALALIEHLESERDDAMAKVPRWISVKERLPEESGHYLYLCDSPILGLQNGVGVSYFQHKAKLWKKVYNPCVTHWMPLPESKKEDA